MSVAPNIHLHHTNKIIMFHLKESLKRPKHFLNNYSWEFGYLIHLFSVSSRLTSLIPRNTRTSHHVNWNPSMWRIQPLPHAWSCLVKTIAHPKMIVIIYLASCCSFFFLNRSSKVSWYQITILFVMQRYRMASHMVYSVMLSVLYVFGMTWWWNTFLSAHSTRVLHVHIIKYN